uniref:Aminopeptidase n=1 Tax=Hyphantria cunea TaxID=39466 RepID=A0A3G1QXU4_HYPCU|nr:aminopeptidase N8 [Hyphantria cunea]
MYCRLLVIAVIYLLPAVYAETDPNYRLNTPIVPSAYQLLITPYFDTNDENAFSFDGEVTINFTTTANANQIKLHSQDLNFTAADITVRIPNSNAIELNNSNPLEFNTQYSFAYINLVSELVPNVDYAVTITYKGPLRTDLNGFYRNYYLENGVKKWLGATQMEPTHARKAFPCFDEPQLKATFTISIDRPSNYKNSLSNMKMQTSVDLGNGYVREIFYPTPRMPTYLVAFLVSEFEAGQYRNGTQEFGIYSRPEAKNQSLYAFDFGIKVVEELGRYFGIDYYSTDYNLKLDHVAIPDFRAGAMENWGLVKYREALLLTDPEETAPYFRYRIAQILAHETTHMWFGNLVTCHWWSDTWLNEGFANYFQDYITSLIEPELGSANLLVTSSAYTAYAADDNPFARALTNDEVNSPAEISDHFGSITYQKGGSVIRMIHHLIGDDVFRLGLRTYLTNNALGSGYPNLLYAALDYAVTTQNSLNSYPNATVADVMGSWISQAGHPIVHVNINYNTDTVTLTQKRFYKNASYLSNETYKIPITYTTGLSPNFNNTKPMFIMYDRSHEFTIANVSQTWVIFNVQDSGFYKVNYDQRSWELIASLLKGQQRTIIHHLNRAKIVNDLFAFLYGDEVDFSLLHNILEFLSEEDEYSVWLAALNGFKNLRNSYLGNNNVLPHVESYILKFLSSYIDRFGYVERSNDSFEDLRNRQQILEFACKLDHSGCVTQAAAMFKALRENGTEVSPSLRSVVYSTGLRYGTGEDYDFLWNRARTTNLASEIWIILDVLGHTTNEERLRRYLVSMTEENSPVRTQDLSTPLASVLSNHSNLALVMDLLKTDYDLWTSIYTTMDSVLSNVALNLRTESEFSEFETFLSSCTACTYTAKTAAMNSLQTARASKSWADTHESAILSKLKNNSNTAIPSIFMLIISLAILFMRY